MLDILLERRISLKALADLCYRMTTSLGAGVDVRKSWDREARNSRGRARAAYLHISDAINEGSSVSAAVRGTGTFFPTLFREMVTVGEESGHLAEIFRQLCDHYNHQLQLRKVFFSAITWPLVELGMALGVVGFLIWIMGLIADMHKGSKPMDLLGFGLIGTPGLIRYVLFLAALAALGFALYRAVRQGVIWVAPLQRLILRVPRLGRALEILALARIAWSMHLTMNAGMELRRALTLSLRGTNNVRFTSAIPQILASVSAGQTIHESFAATGAFPHDFLDAVEVGEESGRLVETLAVLSNRYQEEARGAMQTLTALAGFAVWAVVAMMIAMLIFRLFSSYVGAINDAVKMR